MVPNWRSAARFRCATTGMHPSILLRASFSCAGRCRVQCTGAAARASAARQRDWRVCGGRTPAQPGTLSLAWPHSLGPPYASPSVHWRLLFRSELYSRASSCSTASRCGPAVGLPGLGRLQGCWPAAVPALLWVGGGALPLAAGCCGDSRPAHDVFVIADRPYQRPTCCPSTCSNGCCLPLPQTSRLRPVVSHPQARSGSGAAALPEPTEAELEELYQAVDFHPEEQQAAAAAASRAGGAAAAGLHLTLDCLLTKASLLLLDGGSAAGAAATGPQGAAAAAEGSGSNSGSGIAALELDQLSLQVQAQPNDFTASLKLSEIALHDLCSCPGLSSQLLSRGAPASVAAAAQAAAASATPGSLTRSPVLRLQFRSAPAAAAEAAGGVGEQGGEPQPQLDVLVQPLLLRVRPLCLQRLLALVPPAVPVSGAWTVCRVWVATVQRCFVAGKLLPGTFAGLQLQLVLAGGNPLQKITSVYPSACCCCCPLTPSRGASMVASWHR